MGRSIGVSVLSGFAVGIALYVLISLLGWNGPRWIPILDQLVGALTAILPGLVAGSVSRRLGFVVGATAGVAVSVAVSLLTATVDWPPFWEPQEITGTFVVDSIGYVVAALITNGISGIAGQHLFKTGPSNPALNSDAVRPHRAG